MSLSKSTPPKSETSSPRDSIYESVDGRERTFRRYKDVGGSRQRRGGRTHYVVAAKGVARRLTTRL